MFEVKKISSRNNERKALCKDTFQVKKVGGDVFVEGWANKAVVDRGKDIIRMDAWNLQNYQKVPVILFNHDKDKPIGKAVEVKATEAGLWVKAKLSKSKDPEISRVRDLVQEGILNAFSVGFDSQDEEKDGEGINNIKQAELYEISVVTLPMNQDSVFSMSAKALAGLSKQEAISKILIEKGARVADAVHVKIYEGGVTKDELLKSVSESTGLSLDDVAKVLAGNVNPVPDKVLEALAEVLGLDASGLQKLQEEPMEEEPKPEEEEKPKAVGADIQVVGVLIPKDKADSPEAAGKLAQEAGYDGSNVQEQEQGYFVIQNDPAQFAEGQTSQLDLGNGCIAIIGVKKPQDSKAEEVPSEEPPPEEAPPAEEEAVDPVEQFKVDQEAAEAGAPPEWVGDTALWEQAVAAGNEAGESSYAFLLSWYIQNGGGKKGLASSRTKQAEGAPLPGASDATINASENPYIEQAKQTNVLLGVLIEEFRGLSKKLDSVAIQKIEEPKEEVEEVPSKEAELEKAIIENISGYLSDLETKLKKLGA